jgi:hypothetical protein
MLLLGLSGWKSSLRATDLEADRMGAEAFGATDDSLRGDDPRCVLTGERLEGGGNAAFVLRKTWRPINTSAGLVFTSG